MRRLLMVIGVILIAVPLLGLAFIDTQLRYTLFGLPQTNGTFLFGQGGDSVTRTSGSLVQQGGYLRAVLYLSEVCGLALTILGSTLPAKSREKKDGADSETPSELPPWKEPDQ